MQWINGMKQSSEIDSMYNFVYGKDVIKNQNNIRSVWSNLHKWKTLTMTLKYWKNISWIRKLHTTEMSIVPKLVYRLETISLQFWGTKLGSAGLHTVKPIYQHQVMVKERRVWHRAKEEYGQLMFKRPELWVNFRETFFKDRVRLRVTECLISS